MVKVTVNGEVFSFDNERYPLTEAIELEEGLGIPFGEWQRDGLWRGSAKALAGFVWLVLKRSGRDVPLADILSGAYPMDALEINVESEGAPGADPTVPASPPAAGSGSASSPRSTDTPPPSSTP